MLPVLLVLLVLLHPRMVATLLNDTSFGRFARQRAHQRKTNVEFSMVASILALSGELLRFMKAWRRGILVHLGTLQMREIPLLPTSF